VHRPRQPDRSLLPSDSIPPQNPPLVTALLSSPSALFSRVRIHLIPLNLRFLCFHTFTHSFVPSKITTLFFSYSSALFAQKHRGVGSHLSNQVLFDPLFAFLLLFLRPSAFDRQPLSAVLCASAPLGDQVSRPYRSNRASTRQTCQRHFARKPFPINRPRTLSITNRGGGSHHRHLFKFYFNSSRLPLSCGEPASYLLSFHTFRRPPLLTPLPAHISEKPQGVGSADKAHRQEFLCIKRSQSCRRQRAGRDAWRAVARQQRGGCQFQECGARQGRRERCSCR